MASTKAYLRLSRRTRDIDIAPGRLGHFRVRLASSSALWRVQGEKKLLNNSIVSRDAQAPRTPGKWQLFVGAGVMMYSTGSLAAAGDALSLSPAVKYLINTNSITQADLSLIKPSGPKARILKGDVLQYLDDIKSGRISHPSTREATATQTPPPQVKSSTPVPVVKVDSRKATTDEKTAYVDIPVDEVQRTRAQQMVESKSMVPHTYVTASCNVQKVVELINTRNRDNTVSGQSSSQMVAFLVKAAALTLERIPECNAIWSASEAPQSLSSVNISVTVWPSKGTATTLSLGDVNRWRVQDITKMVEEVSNESHPPQTQAESFSIIYLGDSGISNFTAILTHPQSAILTVGSVKLQPAVGSQTKTTSATIAVTLSADARVYHDELACKWLDEFKRTLEAPEACGLL